MLMMRTLDLSTDRFAAPRAGKEALGLHRVVIDASPPVHRAPQESPWPSPFPTPQTRWRCGGCGNLTRFDVTRTTRSTEYWHFDLAGAHRVEERTTEVENVESVTCRWCGRSDAIELVSRAEADARTS